MINTSPITKTAFLEAFKTCDKYLNCRYIEQEAFFNNMVYAMLVARQNLPGNIYPAPEFFDDVSFRKDVIDTVKKMGLTYWRKYRIYSEEMRAEARSHYFTAGTDAAGIAIGFGIGKAASKVTKYMSRPYSKKLLKVGKNNGNRMKMSFNRLQDTKVPTELNMKIHVKTRHTVWGTSYDFNIKDGIKIRNTDTIVDFSINPIEIADNLAIGALTEEVHQNVASGKNFSFGDINDSWMWKTGDKITDFVPYVGNAKAAVSSFVNYKIGNAYSETAKIAEENEQKSMDADSNFIRTHLFVDIEKDLNAMDKTTLYQMGLFATKQSNIK